MGVEIRCSRCLKQYVVAETLAGKRVKCRECGSPVDVPPLGSPAQPALPRDLSDLLDEPARPSMQPSPLFPTAGPGGHHAAAPVWSVPAARSPQWGGGVPTWFWIVLASVGGLFVVCCGGVWGFMQLLNADLSTSAEAIEPFPVAATPVPSFPDRGPVRLLEPGIQLHEMQWGPGNGYTATPGTSGKMWLYLPAGEARPRALPCVLVTGAGTTLLYGTELGDGDYRDEHLPYVRQGIAVLAYEVDGPIAADDASDAEYARGYQAFKNAHAGLVNARNALEFVLAKVPEVDPQQIYAAGHSSAATLAMLFAEHEPRLAGCAAYAPAIDLEERFERFTIRQMSGQLPGLEDFVVRSSPKTHEARLRPALWLFHALDDSNVPAAGTQAAAARLKQLNKDVTLTTVPSGDHYDSMIEAGIPGAIRWIKQRSGNP